MKPKNKIYPLLRMLAVALTAALLGPGCQKDFKWNEPLAVTQNGLNLTSPAGSTRVTVYSTGRWKAEMAEGAWGEVSEVSGNGIGDFLFTYEANNGVSRRARILVSGSCMKMILSAALGNLSAATIVAPLYWDVSYSLDGSTFTRFDTVPIRTLVYWAGPQWYVPGLYEVDFDLPSACFGQKDVTIRLQAASKVCGSTTGEDNGTTTKTYVYFRFGDVSVKYF